ncbi:MAG TPA: hypothetical protein VIW92_00245 [Thermoanaerobaculia bacterium]
MSLVQSAVAVFWIVARAFHRPSDSPLANIEALQYDGDLLAVTTSPVRLPSWLWWPFWCGFVEV